MHQHFRNMDPALLAPPPERVSPDYEYLFVPREELARRKAVERVRIGKRQASTTTASAAEPNDTDPVETIGPGQLVAVEDSCVGDSTTTTAVTSTGSTVSVSVTTSNAWEDVTAKPSTLAIYGGPPHGEGHGEGRGRPYGTFQRKWQATTTTTSSAYDGLIGGESD
jgi:hypothetical protein